MIETAQGGFPRYLAEKCPIEVWLLENPFVLLDARRGITTLDQEFLDFLEEMESFYQIILTKIDAVRAEWPMVLLIKESAWLTFDTMPLLITLGQFGVDQIDCERHTLATESFRTFDCHLLEGEVRRTATFTEFPSDPATEMPFSFWRDFVDIGQIQAFSIRLTESLFVLIVVLEYRSNSPTRGKPPCGSSIINSFDSWRSSTLFRAHSKAPLAPQAHLEPTKSMFPRKVYRPVEQEDSDENEESRSLQLNRNFCGQFVTPRRSILQSFLRLTCLLPTFLLVLTYLYLYATQNETGSCALHREHVLQNHSKNSNLFRAPSEIPLSERFARLGQKGATVWFTGLPGSGKSTIGKALERLLLQKRAHVIQLDGDNLRLGLNQDLSFSNADRKESVRRAGEVAALFSEAGVIALVTLISPFREDRDYIREMHRKKGIPFYEVFVDVNISVAIERDPKGLYARAIKGEIKEFTGISSPYEPPTQPDIHLETATMSVEEEAEILMRYITAQGILTWKEVSKEYPGIAVADGVNSKSEFEMKYPSDPVVQNASSTYKDLEQYPRVLLRHEDVHWLQVIGEGWASPLKGFMREGVYLQSLHFSSALCAVKTTGGGPLSLSPSNFQSNCTLSKAERVSFPVPIVLPIHSTTKNHIGKATKVVLVSPVGEELAILHDPEIYSHRKDERIARTFGNSDTQHPVIQEILHAGDLLLGGEVEMLQRVRYNDGLDAYRLTPTELRQRFQQMKADVVVAFQTRNPTHAGHVYLMDSARKQLIHQGFKNPVLWLSPLGGWTKDDDVPLDVRLKQHEAVLSAGVLNVSSTVLAIWPSPMIYAGPKEVQWHAKSRRNAGASVFIVGRDPAGIKSHGKDLYDQDHGRFVLHVAPGLEDLQLMSFDKVYYDVNDQQMKPMEKGREADFLSISGSRMRTMAEKGLSKCSGDMVPKLWKENPNCVPPSFMVDSGWQIMVNYYKHRSFNWLRFSIQQSKPFLDATRSFQVVGTFGQPDYKLFFQDTNKKLISPWHDIPLRIPEKHLYNFVVEIPKGVMYKMEVNKESAHNPIMQDTTHNGTRGRSFLYGVPFFNYGMFPQTWENPQARNTDGNGGDNDPLDVLEIGSRKLPMGSVNPVKILGSLALIDQGEVDHKILVLSIDDPEANHINSVDDLEPGVLEYIIDWLRNYKTAEGYPVNRFTQEHPLTPKEAEEIVLSNHDHWKALRNGSIENRAFFNPCVILCMTSIEKRITGRPKSCAGKLLDIPPPLPLFSFPPETRQPLTGTNTRPAHLPIHRHPNTLPSASAPTDACEFLPGKHPIEPTLVDHSFTTEEEGYVAHRVHIYEYNEPAIQSQSNAPADTLRFDSLFESGNLLRVYRVFRQAEDQEYELLLHPDVGNSAYRQWFYFQTQNGYTNVEYTFHIINLAKSGALFGNGLQPLVYSSIQASGWKHQGSHIHYEASKSEMSPARCNTLSFRYTFQYDHDKVYFACLQPYTFTDLCEYCDNLEQDRERSPYLKRSELCLTLAGNVCDLLTITSPARSRGTPYDQRRIVVISARVHPGEANSSWMVKGMIDHLTSSSFEAQVLREHYIFKIVPMLNPDGVILGNSRVGLAGWDLNRKWSNPVERLFPTVFHLKKLIASHQAHGRVAVYCDLHGHSLHHNIFMYGCYKHKLAARNFKVAGPTLGTDPRVFPMILAKDSPFFFYKSCDFRVHKSKLHTGRVVVHNELGVVHSYTLEASFCGPDYGPRKHTQFSALDLEAMGRDWCESLLRYMRLLGYVGRSTELWRGVKIAEDQKGFMMEDSGAGLADLVVLIDIQDDDEHEERLSQTDAEGLDLSDIDEFTPEREDLAILGSERNTGKEVASHRPKKPAKPNGKISELKQNTKAVVRHSASSSKMPTESAQAPKMVRTAITKEKKKSIPKRSQNLHETHDSVTKVRRSQSIGSTPKRPSVVKSGIVSKSQIVHGVNPARLVPGIGHIELPEVAK
uniref:APS kinase/ATP sulfurlyase/pyrophosphatase fusion protein putative n=1 Tax=Albugo laibachii Nc14 TaxID=890382 RepID=F0W067_9STRA|nr:APS kinase/ATP sulfurlyase/pyrophosphatase fusion protein putative [Albugo laibachii Nc14]|eukprot:CCA14438.1 APS kinase/ATP sulfurlyase/pyrophosphatase fusion protein putative [Albugo laibachii Nc14]